MPQDPKDRRQSTQIDTTHPEYQYLKRAMEKRERKFGLSRARISGPENRFDERVRMLFNGPDLFGTSTPVGYETAPGWYKPVLGQFSPAFNEISLYGDRTNPKFADSTSVLAHEYGHFVDAKTFPTDSVRSTIHENEFAKDEETRADIYGHLLRQVVHSQPIDSVYSGYYNRMRSLLGK